MEGFRYYACKLFFSKLHLYVDVSHISWQHRLMNCVNGKCVQYCDDDNQCSNEDHCVKSICMSPCRNSKDCQQILLPFCAKRRCIPPTCNKQNDCGLGNRCISEKCIIGCQHKGDCVE